MKLDYRTFTISLISLYLLTWIVPINWLQQLVFGLAYSGLVNLGMSVSYTSPLTLSTGFGQFYVGRECTGVLSIALLWSLLIATKGLKNKSKLLFGFLGFVILPIWNGIRVLLSIYLGGPNFETFHFTLWMVSLGLILAVYLLAVMFSKSEN